jgi:hypothetical protein
MCSSCQPWIIKHLMGINLILQDYIKLSKDGFAVYNSDKKISAIFNKIKSRIVARLFLIVLLKYSISFVFIGHGYF